MGGGGEISFPGYLDKTHSNWLREWSNDTTGTVITAGSSMVDLINTALTADGNPFTTGTGESEEPQTVYDPGSVDSPTTNSPLAKMQSNMDDLEAVLDTLNTAGYFDDFTSSNLIDNLSTTVDDIITTIESALNTVDFSDVVNDFETREKGRFLRNLSMWTAGMADVNAVHTSSFVIGMALKQKDLQDKIDAFENNLATQTNSQLFDRILGTALSADIQGKLSVLQAKNSLTQNAAGLYSGAVQLRNQIETMTMEARSQEDANQIKIDHQAATWDFEAFMYGGNLMAAPSGAPAGRKTDPTLSNISKGLTIVGSAMSLIPGLQTIGIGVSKAGAATGAAASADSALAQQKQSFPTN